MKKIIISGFEPFLDHSVNPTEWLVKKLHGNVINGAEIKGICLPVSFERAGQELIKLVTEEQPIAVMMLGLAANRKHITPERVAINVMDGPNDNDGHIKQDQSIIEGAPNAYFSTLPIRTLVSELEEIGVDSAISNTAGTYVCNALMFQVQHFLHSSGQDIPNGFVHIPFTKESGKNENLTNERLLAAVEVMIAQLVVYSEKSSSK